MNTHWLVALAKTSAWAALVFALLGLVPGVESPLNKLATNVISLNSALANHDRDTSQKLDELIAAARQTCLNTARDSYAASGCWKGR